MQYKLTLFVNEKEVIHRQQIIHITPNTTMKSSSLNTNVGNYQNQHQHTTNINYDNNVMSNTENRGNYYNRSHFLSHIVRTSHKISFPFTLSSVTYFPKLIVMLTVILTTFLL